MSKDSICYAEGSTSDDACNEVLSPSSDGPLMLQAMMAMGFSYEERGFGDMKKLTPEKTDTRKGRAEYLWHGSPRSHATKVDPVTSTPRHVRFRLAQWRVVCGRGVD